MRIKAILLAILILIYATSCSNTRDNIIEVTDKYAKYLILDMTENRYLDSIKTDLELVYAPPDGITTNDVKNRLEKHMTDKCIEQFISNNPSRSENIKGLSCEIQEIMFLYGQHQQDGISRVMSSLRVQTTTRYWQITLEMRLNKDGMIYEAIPY